VVTQNGGPAESLRDGEDEFGVLVDPADPAAIAAGLQRALGEDRERLAAAGRQRVLDRYTWDKTADGYVAALESALRRETDPEELPVRAWFRDPVHNAPPTTSDLALRYLPGSESSEA